MAYTNIADSCLFGVEVSGTVAKHVGRRGPATRASLSAVLSSERKYAENEKCC